MPSFPPGYPDISKATRITSGRREGKPRKGGDRSREDYESLRKRMDALLENSGPVKESFDRLCAAGCDGVELRSLLYESSNHPFSRSKRVYTSAVARKLESMAKQADLLAKQLEKLDWELTLPLVGEGLLTQARKCSGVAKAIRDIQQAQKQKRFVHFTATQTLPCLVAHVKEKTGKPHFVELATLVGAAYQRPDFSEDELKMRFHREVRREEKKAAQWRAASLQKKNTDRL